MTPNCKHKCSTKLSLSHRESIFNSFYKLDGNSQNNYLFKSMSPFTPQIQRVGAKSHRAMSFRYHVSVDGKVVHVCKKAFTALHQITESKIYHLAQQIQSGASAPHPSYRGKHKRRPNQISPEQIQSVVDHINLFPTEPSH